MAKLAADRPNIFQLVGPGGDKADTAPTAASVGLIGREGGGRDLRPARRGDGRAAPRADPACALEIALDRQSGQPGKTPVEMQRAGWPGRVGAAIIGRENKDRVVELTQRVEQGYEATDILVGAVEH